MCSLLSFACWQSHSCVLEMPVCLHFQQLEWEHRVPLCSAKKGPSARVNQRRSRVQWLWWTAVQLKIDQGRSTGPGEPGEQAVPQRFLSAVPGTPHCSTPGPLHGCKTNCLRSWASVCCESGLQAPCPKHEVPDHALREHRLSSRQQWGLSCQIFFALSAIHFFHSCPPSKIACI